MTVLTAYYDLAVGPVSFDFVVFAIKAEMAREKAKADKLHLIIVPFERGVAGMFRDKTAFYDEHEMRWRLWNICVPAAQLLDAHVTLAPDWTQAKRLAQVCWPSDWDRQTLKDRRHLVGDVITWNRGGAPVPELLPSMHAGRKVEEAFKRLGKPVVTMTLRSTYLKERNSDLGAWDRARRHIESKGYAVVILQDTDVALSQGNGYGELNLDVRMACYDKAALNLQANNGAASLCWFGTAPYRMFGAGVPAEEWNGLFVKQGLPLGTTWPWAKPGQKLVYGPTSADQIIAEFDQWAGGVK